jgi:hypothetical protein
MYQLRLSIHFLLCAGAAAQYCQPDQPCWPSPTQWAALNASAHGHLLAVLPEAAVCYPSQPVYSASACTAVQASWNDSYWRRAQPGAMQEPNWEEVP